MKYCHGGDIYTYEGMLDFSVNINPLGPSKAVMEAAKRGVEQMAAYPDSRCRKLRKKLSEKLKVSEESILFGNGAAELIYNLVRAERPKRALLPVPSFSEYEQALVSVGCQVEYCHMSRADDFSVTEDLLGALTEEMDLLFLCSPSNPSGKAVEKELLERIALRCEELGIRLVLDECFVEFLPDAKERSMIRETARFPHLFVLRAFTKMHAMAGLRLGYGVTSDENLAEKMERISQPWNVSIPAQEAGMAALDEGEREEKTIRLICSEREKMEEEMRKMGIDFVSSDANFILFKGKDDLFERFVEEGILIRDCSDYVGLKKGWFRTAVRTGEENRIFLEALARIIETEKEDGRCWEQ